MSNQSVNGFQGSQPFITDNQYKSLSLEQLRYILNQKKKTIKKNYKELSEKEKLNRDIRKLDKLRERVQISASGHTDADQLGTDFFRFH